jgi:hypothetical protein
VAWKGDTYANEKKQIRRCNKFVLLVVNWGGDVWNTGVTITEDNKTRIYRILKNMIGTTKFLVVGVFVFLLEELIVRK